MIRPKQRGFTLVELVVVVSVIALLAGVLVPNSRRYLSEHRDARRLAHVERLSLAIERYHDDKGHYPTPVGSASFGGWEASTEGAFLAVLVEEGYLDGPLLDPINDGLHHYRYWVYQPGRYGCGGDEPFYVLGVQAFETERYARANQSRLGCPERVWGNEFAYAVGGGASFEP